MPLPQNHHSGYTISDYQTWEGRWELLDGVAFDMTPAPSIKHQRMSMRLERLVSEALSEARRKSGSGDCELFHAPVDVFLNPNTVVQPDVLVVCDSSKITERGIEGAPDLVAEILSPGTALRDLNTKRWLYEAAMVPEYLVLDPDNGTAELFVLGLDGKYASGQRLTGAGSLILLGGRLPIVWESATF